MNVLFVAHNGLSSNSGNHVVRMALALRDLGLSPAIAVPDEDFGPNETSDELSTLRWSQAAHFRFSDGRTADAVHAWTPRQHVAAATRSLASLHDAPYLVHLEDNEHFLTAAHNGLTTRELLRRASSEEMVLPQRFAHPMDMADFLAKAAGVSALIDDLLEFKPEGIPGVVFWPAAEEHFRPAPADPKLRQDLKISPDATVLVYHGNSHQGNMLEVRSLYIAVAVRNASGRPTVLVRLGQDHAPVVPADLGELKDHVIQVPFQPRSELPRYLALADVLVQPGRLDAFNRYRFPSKLPEFLAMGRPTILPATNIGLSMRDGVDAILLKRGDAIEIVNAIDAALASTEQASRLGRSARAFYDTHLSWPRAASRLREHYWQVARMCGASAVPR